MRIMIPLHFNAVILDIYQRIFPTLHKKPKVGAHRAPLQSDSTNCSGGL
jgi:hypothetical protein